VAEKLFANILPSPLLAVMTTVEDGDMRDQGNIDIVSKRWFGHHKRYHCQQIHQTMVAWSEEVQPGNPVEGADGLLSADNKGVLTIRTADCLPLFIWDDTGATTGLLHAGWRGVADNILSTALGQLEQRRIPLDTLWLGIGAGICQDCFEVDHTLAPTFSAFPEAVRSGKSGKSHIDLKHIVRQQWASFGGKPSHVVDCEACTHCDASYYSYRRNQTAGRMLAMLGRKDVHNG